MYLSQAIHGSKLKATDKSGYVVPSAEDIPLWQITSRTRGIIETLRAIHKIEGITGLWRGQNYTWINGLLSSVIYTWLSSALAAAFHLPDPDMIELLPTINTSKIMLIAMSSSAITSLLLSPLDIRRTRSIISSKSEPKRKDSSKHSQAPYFCPRSLVLPTILHSCIPTAINLYTPIFLRENLSIDGLQRPKLFAWMSFVGYLLENTIRMPLETVLRRGQAQICRVKCTIVRLAPYNGLFGTGYSAIRQEENGSTGVGSLYRGWKLSILKSLVGCVLKTIEMSRIGPDEVVF